MTKQKLIQEIRNKSLNMITNFVSEHQKEAFSEHDKIVSLLDKLAQHDPIQELIDKLEALKVDDLINDVGLMLKQTSSEPLDDLVNKTIKVKELIVAVISLRSGKAWDGIDDTFSQPLKNWDLPNKQTPMKEIEEIQELLKSLLPKQ